MKFLVDNALSPLVATGLREAGYDAVHIRDYGMQSATDEQIFDTAAAEDRIIVSADTDFGTLLAARNENKPSVILFRRISGHAPDSQMRLLSEYVSELEEDLSTGSAVVIEETRLRIRSLPINADSGQIES